MIKRIFNRSGKSSLDELGTILFIAVVGPIAIGIAYLLFVALDPLSGPLLILIVIAIIVRRYRKRKRMKGDSQ